MNPSITNPTPVSTTTSAAVRAYFALSQVELARFLGVGKAHINNVEAGRNVFSTAVERRLRLLTRWLPQNQPAAAPPAAPAPGPLDPAPLRSRLERCRHLAIGVRYELEELRRRAAACQHRQQALELLATALLPDPNQPAALPPDPAADPVRDAAWLERLRADTACAPPAPARAEVALREVRLAVLDYEVYLLEQKLAAG